MKPIAVSKVALSHAVPVLSVLTLCAAAGSVLAQATLQTVGAAGAQASAVSGDGSTIVGYALSGSNTRPTRWLAATPSIGTDLGTLSPDALGNAHAVSADGSIIVGESGVSWLGPRAFRRTDAEGMIQLTGTFSAQTLGISRDGVVSVGARGNHGAIWTGSGPTGTLQEFNAQSGYDLAIALGISDDYSTVVGYSTLSGGDGFSRAFLWHSNTGLQPLSYLPSTTTSYAHAISADGSIIIGFSGVSDFEGGQGNAVRWTSGGAVVQSLGHLSGTIGASANALSANGSIIVGQSYTASWRTGGSAFIWTAQTGMISLAAYLQSIGVTPAIGLTSATGISDDGRVIVGTGTASPTSGSAISWVAKIPAPGSFSLSSPDDNTLALPLQPTLSWTPSAAAASYSVTITPQAGAPTTLTTPSTSIQLPPGTLQSCQTYTWSVQASNIVASTTASSAPRSFQTLRPGDFNHDGAVSVPDIFAFLTAWFASDPAADINGNGLGVSDIFDFLAAWFAGCP